MTIAQLLSQLWIMIPVVLLFVTGFALTLQSGHVRLTTSQGVRQMVGNLSSTMWMLGICFMLVILAQTFAGYKVGASW